MESNKTKPSEATIQKVKELIESGSIDQVTLANRIEYSSSTISLYLKGRYNGNIQNLEKALNKYLVLHNNTQNHEKVALDFEETSVASRFFSIAKMCRLNGEINLCYGSSGIGKSTAIKKFADEFTGVIVIDPDEGATTRSVLKQLVEKLGLTPVTTKSEDLTSTITNRLNNSNFLVIVDEAENVKTEVIRSLRKIHDRCSSTFGLLFVGTETLYQNLRKLRSEFNYLMNRIGYVGGLHPLDRGDVESLVRQIFPDCNEECLDAFVSCSQKNARVLFNILKRAKDLQRGTNDELNPKMIVSARGLLLV
ncbi:MAG: AAA family ATPase [Candidatus Gastranaerophilales bacterium]|nr:AAA family ATPase [Candidatus Gastranaerophilales bacterium]